ncbi:MAG: NAD(P)/FAD-dependent oxidoreductase [Calditrichaeota bacterium]|nr:NAD(P)/FAD-dependent oxidoreductase [Calditrichota bacterium]MBT7788232.1 NAD(P)/FAD-dependent oxidoreductase [Calditrichota bacterium]
MNHTSITSTTFDVIIIGGGPSGSSAAIRLSRQGHSVLVVDQHSFPRAKTCGDFYTPSVISLIEEIGLIDSFEESNPHKINNFRVRILDSSVGFDLDIGSINPRFYSFVQPRYDFDSQLLHHARVCGTQFMKATFRAPIIKDGKVIGVRVSNENQEIELFSKILIGADGSNSTVTSKLDRTRVKSRDKAIAIRGYLDEIEVTPGTIEVFISKDIFPGYGWIFPNGKKSANIGICFLLTNSNNKIHNIKQSFYSFINSPIIKSRIAKNYKLRDLKTATINLGMNRKIKRVFNGAILIGDAACLANPIHGGGICNGMTSGLIAAEEIDLALRSETCSISLLKGYESRIEKELLSELQHSKIAHYIAYFSPHLLKVLIWLISKNQFLPWLANQLYKDVKTKIKPL